MYRIRQVQLVARALAGACDQSTTAAIATVERSVPRRRPAAICEVPQRKPLEAERLTRLDECLSVAQVRQKQLKMREGVLSVDARCHRLRMPERVTLPPDQVVN